MAESCGDCGGEMVEGYLLDRAHSEATPTLWVEGRIEKGFLGVKLDDRATADVRAFRCGNCGNLKLKAN